MSSHRFSPTAAAAFHGGSQSDGSSATQPISAAAMHNSSPTVRQRSLSPATSSPATNNNNKRKADGPVYRPVQLSANRRQPPVLAPPAKASESHSVPNHSSIIFAIKAKHGDIVKDCNFKSELMRKLILVGICEVLNDLQKKQLDEIDIVTLENCCDIVRDIEKSNINVKWLLQGLDQIKDAIRSRDEAKVLNNEKNEFMKNVEKKRKEVEGLKRAIEDLDGHIKQLDEGISTRTSKFQQFQRTSLMDRLI